MKREKEKTFKMNGIGNSDQFEGKVIAKFLPVDGQIKENDWVLNINNNRIGKILQLPSFIYYPNINNNLLDMKVEDFGFDIDPMHLRKIGIFAVTQNFDYYPQYIYHIDKKEFIKYHGEGEKSGEIFHNKGFSYPSEVWKIIGEITENITWSLKDNEEIEIVKNNGEIKVKGPCGHFH